MLGAIIGDSVGSKYEFNNIKTKDFEIHENDFEATDDTIMTLAVCDILQRHVANDRDEVIDTLRKWARAYPNAGYGGRFFSWALYDDTRKSYHSCGNGSAMRVAACGWYGRDEEEVKELSKAVTEVTHDHPEGLKGAEVTAMCVYYARIGKDKDFIRNYVEQYYNLDFDYEELRRTYYHGEEICQNTVPQAIYCFLISKSFEDCLRTTISIGGDCDTTAAISCAIAEAYYKEIPTFLSEWTIESLPKARNGCNPKKVVDAFMYDRLSAMIYQEAIGDDTKFVGCFTKNENRQTIQWFFSSSCRLLVECALVYKIQPKDEEGFDYLKVLKIIQGGSSIDELFGIAGLKRFLERLCDETNKFMFFDNVEKAMAFQTTIEEKNNAIEQIFTQEYEIKEN